MAEELRTLQSIIGTQQMMVTIIKTIGWVLVKQWEAFMGTL